jgi:hypothetical protein
VKKLVPGDQWTNHLANETVEYLRVFSPAPLEQPPLDVICVANGLLDVNNRELRPHSPTHLSSLQLSRSPTTENRLNRLNSPDALTIRQS